MRYAWITLSRLLALLTLASLGQEEPMTRRDRLSESELSVSLSLQQRKIMLGQLAEIRIELRNQGSIMVCVDKEITFLRGGNSYVDLRISDEDGTLSDQRVGHVYMISAAPEITEPTCAPWIPLAPGYSYARTIRLDRSVFTMLSAPGKYNISGTYHSARKSGTTLAKTIIPIKPVTIEVVPE